ncbi:MAG: sigma-70 family RNA polymerase sigma factor [Chitinophagales bacterium]
MSESQNILEKLKKGDKLLLNTIYRENRGKFVGWAAKQFNADDEMATEIYQDAVVTLYENIHSGKLTDMTASVESYLFAIGRNKFLELTRYHKKNTSIPDHVEIEQIDEEIDYEEKNEEFEQVGMALKQMGPPCKTLLEFYYYEKKQMDEIATLMDYKNPATAKNQKYKCIQRLKKIVFENISQHE